MTEITRRNFIKDAFKGASALAGVTLFSKERPALGQETVRNDESEKIITETLISQAKLRARRIEPNSEFNTIFSPTYFNFFTEGSVNIQMLSQEIIPTNPKTPIIRLSGDVVKLIRVNEENNLESVDVSLSSEEFNRWLQTLSESALVDIRFFNQEEVSSFAGGNEYLQSLPDNVRNQTSPIPAFVRLNPEAETRTAMWELLPVAANLSYDNE